MKKTYKSVILSIFILFNFQANAFTLIELFLTAGVNCNNVFYINDFLYNSEHTSVNLTINEAEFSSNNFNEITSVNNLSLFNTQFFEYLGFVILDQNEPILSKRHAFRLIYNNFSSSLPLIFTEINIFNNEDLTAQILLIDKKCLQCELCISRKNLKLLLIFQSIINNLDLNDFGQYNSEFADLNMYEKNVLKTILNWILNNPNISIEDYEEMLNPTKLGDSNVPVIFCQNKPNVPCESQQELIGVIQDVVTELTSINPNDENFSGIYYSYLSQTRNFFNENCFPWGEYGIFFIIFNSDLGYKVSLTPKKAFLPAFIINVVFEGSSVYSQIAFSYHYNTGATLSELLNLPDGITYEGNGEFSFHHGFVPY